MAATPSSTGSSSVGTRKPGSRSGKPKRKAANILSHSDCVWEAPKARTGEGFEIRIGKNTVIGPGVTIYADAGSVHIGANCVLGEGVVISHRMPDPKQPPSGKTMEIGNGNLFESLATVEAIKIGDYNQFRSKCHIQREVVFGHGCMVCPRVTVITGTRVPDGTVLFGANMMNEHLLNIQRHRRWMKNLVPLLHDEFRKTKADAKSKGAPSKSGAPSSKPSAGGATPGGTGKIADLRKKTSGV